MRGLIVLNTAFHSAGKVSPTFTSSLPVQTSFSVKQDIWQKAEAQYCEALQVARQNQIGIANTLLQKTLHVNPDYLPSYNLLGILQLVVPQDALYVGYDGIGSFLLKNSARFSIPFDSLAEAETTLNQGVLRDEQSHLFPHPSINLGNIALLQAAWSHNLDIVKPNIQKAIECYSTANALIKGFSSPDTRTLHGQATRFPFLKNAYGDQAAYLKRILAHNVALLEKIMEYKGVKPVRQAEALYHGLQHDIKAVKPESIQKLSKLSSSHLAACLLYPVI